MQSALSDVMSAAISHAADFVTQFSPVLYWVGGIALGMWGLLFARDFFKG